MFETQRQVELQVHGAKTQIETISAITIMELAEFQTELEVK
jgi:hypothetical protein